ncbi:MAG TPA: hypothetical protein VFA03_04970 [Acetobacteraceae bacterium]|nr:hypothetical protein [Acetobacteraceae bacterium]
MADEDQAPGAPPAGHSASAEAAKPASARPGRLERTKTWADTVFALLKALLTLGISAVVIGAAAMLITRDLNRRTITVSVNKDAEKLLADLGTPLDLRLMLVEDVNARIAAVTNIVKLSAFSGLLASDQATPVSFKPFGLDADSDDLTRLVRNVLNIPPASSVQIDLVCARTPCTGGAGTPLNLVVDIKGGVVAEQRLTFQLPVINPGLRHGIREAMERSSERLLESVEPLLASVYYFNRSYGPDVPGEEQRQNLRRSVAAAYAGRRGGTQGCLADIMLGAASLIRGQVLAGASLLQQVATAPDSSITCRVHGRTNISLFLTLPAFCTVDPGMRGRLFKLVEDQLAALDGLQGMSPEETDRVTAIKAQVETAKSFSGAVPDQGRLTVCQGLDPAVGGAPDDAAYDALLKTVSDWSERLPPVTDDPEANNGAARAIALTLVTLEPAIAHNDFYNRARIGWAISRFAERYLRFTDHPRQFFLAQGRALEDAGLAELAAAGLSPNQALGLFRRLWPEQDPRPGVAAMLHQLGLGDLAAAAIAFDNAAATTGVNPLEPESASDLEPLVLLGDAELAMGNPVLARENYARAAALFVERDEPRAEFMWVVRAMTHWAVLRIRSGACDAGSGAPDPEWGTLMTELGAASDGNICVLRSAEPAPAGELRKLGLIGSLTELVAPAIRGCWNSDAEDPPGTPADARDRQTLFCLRRTGPDSPKAARAFLDANTFETLDAMLNGNR